MTGTDAELKYDTVCFRILAEEFDDPPHAAERRIRRQLRRLGLGSYSKERVDLLRSLKDELFAEIRKFDGSSYYRDQGGAVASAEDFDGDALAVDLGSKYPSIDANEMRGMVAYSVYLFYLR